ncbi:PPOX class F420-dependent oxidoreductase [Rhodococcus sp. NPDC047139]|uniref:PPOX class F420-dependent oxidoreductase n=1 Tax=Rhodococcus sp. NPDC047139 TaxID=3155141 RepID=UPI0033DE73FC
MPADETALEALFAPTGVATLVTLKRDGRPQLSNITYRYEPDTRTFFVSVTDDRAKTRNIRRDPRVSLFVESGDKWSYAVAEGEAELSTVAADPHDDTVEQLVALYRAVQGEHPDWDDFRAAMVADRRLLLRVAVSRFYGATR